MASNVPNRKTIRQALAAAMEADLVGLTHAAQKLYRYKVSKFTDKTTHIILVTSGSADRARQAQPTRAYSTLEFEIWLFVLYSAESWTEEQSEDKLDDMEKEVQDWLLDHADTSELWQGIEPQKTEVDIVIIGGKAYRQELIPINVPVFSE